MIFSDFDKSQVFLASIDCFHFKCQEFQTDPSSKWYSHKHNGPGLSYKVCVDVVKDRIVWTNGPFPAPTHDITFFWGGTKKSGKNNWNRSSFYHKMPPGKRIVGDSGYCGKSDTISTSLMGILPRQMNYLLGSNQGKNQSLLNSNPWILWAVHLLSQREAGWLCNKENGNAWAGF